MLPLLNRSFFIAPDISIFSIYAVKDVISKLLMIRSSQLITITKGPVYDLIEGLGRTKQYTGLARERCRILAVYLGRTGQY